MVTTLHPVAISRAHNLLQRLHYIIRAGVLLLCIKYGGHTGRTQPRGTDRIPLYQPGHSVERNAGVHERRQPAVDVRYDNQALLPFQEQLSKRVHTLSNEGV